MSMLLAVLLLGQIAAPVAGDETTPAPTPAFSAGVVSGDPNKKVCRQIAMTGSIIPVRHACQTRAAWAKFDAENGAAYDNLQTRGHRSWGHNPNELQ